MARSEFLSPIGIVHPPLSPARAVASDETSESSSSSSEEEPETISSLTGKLRTEIPDTDDDMTDIEDADISNSQDEDSSNNDMTEIESVELADDEKDLEGEGIVAGEESSDDKQDSEGEGTVDGEEPPDDKPDPEGEGYVGTEKASDDEVNPDGAVADEAETLTSTERNKIPSPDTNFSSSSDLSDFEAPERKRRKRKPRSRHSTQDAETEPKLVMRGTPNLILREHLKAQVRSTPAIQDRWLDFIDGFLASRR